MNLYLVINCLKFLSLAYAVAIQPLDSSFLGGREIATKGWVIIWRIVGFPISKKLLYGTFWVGNVRKY
jgi:hypothetical protein